MRILTIVLLLATGLSLVTGCVSHDEVTLDPITCPAFEADPHPRVEVPVLKPGTRLFLTVCANPSTGYEWLLAGPGDAAVIEKDGSQEYQAPEDERPGAAGEEVWTFLAVERGETILTLSWDQPWQGGKKAARTVTLAVRVD